MATTLDLDYSKIPAMPPPPGLASNFVSPPSLGPATTVVGVIMIVLTVFFVGTRLYSNVRITRSLGLDDYACIIATIISFVYTGVVIDMKDYARHQWDIPVSWFTTGYLQELFAQEILLGPAIFFAKLALLLLYLRLFSPSKRMRYLIYFGIVFSFCLYFTNLPLDAIMCAPRHGQAWDDLNVLAQCEKTLPFAIVQGTLNVAVDLFVLWLPIPVVWHLNMPTKKKIGIIGIFTTGLFAVAASILGMIYRIRLNHTEDLTWNQAIVYILVIVEINIAIMCSSMPAFSSFLKHTFTNTSYLATFRSRFLSRSKDSRVRSKNPPSSKSSSFPPDSMDGIDSRSHLPDNGYLELGEGPGIDKYMSTRTKTHIRGGDVRDSTPQLKLDSELGGIVKSVDLELSFRENPFVRDGIQPVERQ